MSLRKMKTLEKDLNMSSLLIFKVKLQSLKNNIFNNYNFQLQDIKGQTMNCLRLKCLVSMILRTFRILE